MIRGLVVATLAVAGCADDGGPRLDAVMPAAAARDGQVMLFGSRLCGSRGDCESAGGEITIGIDPPFVQAAVLAYEDMAATIVIPTIAPVGKTQLVVTVNERSSNALEFEVLP